MDSNLLAWAPYLIGAAVLAGFGPGRRLLGLIWLAALFVIGLLAFSEPDLRD